jgi:hypothetical protein
MLLMIGDEHDCECVLWFRYDGDMFSHKSQVMAVQSHRAVLGAARARAQIQKGALLILTL